MPMALVGVHHCSKDKPFSRRLNVFSKRLVSYTADGRPFHTATQNLTVQNQTQSANSEKLETGTIVNVLQLEATQCHMPINLGHF